MGSSTSYTIFQASEILKFRAPVHKLRISDGKSSALLSIGHMPTTVILLGHEEGGSGKAFSKKKS